MMNRREFSKSTVAVISLSSVAMAEDEKPKTDEYPAGDGVFNSGVLLPTGLQYPSGKADVINVLIVAPQAAAVLAGYTKSDRLEKGDKWGLTVFHGKHVVPVDSDAAAIEYYRQLDELPEWTPCIVRLPKITEVDLLAEIVHCDKHSEYRQKCESCRKLLDEHHATKRG